MDLRVFFFNSRKKYFCISLKFKLLRLASPSRIFCRMKRSCPCVVGSVMGWRWMVFLALGLNGRRFFEWSAFLFGSVISSYWLSGLCLEMVFQLIVLSLGMAISFNPLLSVAYLKDFIFQWRSTCCSIVMRQRRYLACLMFPRIYSSSTSWFRWVSQWFAASIFMYFRCFCYTLRYVEIWFNLLQCMFVGKWLKWFVRLMMLSIAFCLDCLFLMI